jgi:ABC-type glycerol-3-phosphate transport system substrate-binding protein
VYNLNLNNKQKKMKKVIAIFAIATTLVACGGSSTEVATDSTAVAVDSAVATADTTAAPAVVDTTATK